MSILRYGEFYLDVAKGLISGHSLIHKFGKNNGVPNASFEGVLQVAAQFPWLTAATTVRVKAGGHANDTAGGVGAQAVTIEGLDNTGAFATEDIELAGASVSSSTSTSFWRVFRMHVTSLRVGTYTGNNVDDIVLENTAGNVDLITVLAGEGQSQFGAYSVPLGKTAYVLSILVEADGNKAADFRFFTRESLTDFSTPFGPKLLKLYWDGVLGSTFLSPNAPMLVYPALTDIWMEAQGGGAITEVSVDFEILLVDD